MICMWMAKNLRWLKSLYKYLGTIIGMRGMCGKEVKNRVSKMRKVAGEKMSLDRSVFDVITGIYMHILNISDLYTLCILFTMDVYIA